MQEELKKRYRELKTEELIRIAYVDSKDYRPEAIGIAKSELKRRNVTSDLIANLVTKVQQTKQKHQKLVSTKPLTKGWKAFCLIFPFLAFLIIIFVSKNWIQRKKDAWKWLIYGVILRLGILLLVYLSSI